MSQPSRDAAVSPLAKALGRIPSGLFILTAVNEMHATGMLASWIQQCSFAPPQILVAVNRERYLGDWLTAGAAFTVNILAEGQTSLIKHFARGFEPAQLAFEGLETTLSPHGTTRLNEAHAYLDCRVACRADAGGDHLLIVGEVLDGNVQHDLRPVVHIRKNGLSY